MPSDALFYLVILHVISPNPLRQKRHEGRDFVTVFALCPVPRTEPGTVTRARELLKVTDGFD